jgi:hypothetical protein
VIEPGKQRPSLFGCRNPQRLREVSRCTKATDHLVTLPAGLSRRCRVQFPRIDRAIERRGSIDPQREPTDRARISKAQLMRFLSWPSITARSRRARRFVGCGRRAGFQPVASLLNPVSGSSAIGYPVSADVLARILDAAPAGGQTFQLMAQFIFCRSCRSFRLDSSDSSFRHRFLSDCVIVMSSYTANTMIRADRSYCWLINLFRF